MLESVGRVVGIETLPRFPSETVSEVARVCFSKHSVEFALFACACLTAHSHFHIADVTGVHVALLEFKC